jgi:hypothetical protein
VRFTLKQVLSATFGLAALLMILEHAGAFTKILTASASSYATAFNAVTGHASAGRAGK